MSRTTFKERRSKLWRSHDLWTNCCMCNPVCWNCNKSALFNSSCPDDITEGISGNSLSQTFHFVIKTTADSQVWTRSPFILTSCPSLFSFLSLILFLFLNYPMNSIFSIFRSTPQVFSNILLGSYFQPSFEALKPFWFASTPLEFPHLSSSLSLFPFLLGKYSRQQVPNVC